MVFKLGVSGSRLFVVVYTRGLRAYQGSDFRQTQRPAKSSPDKVRISESESARFESQMEDSDNQSFIGPRV